MNDKIQFERVPLKEFAERVTREVIIKPTEIYRTLGCRLYGEGVYQREAKRGAEIRAKRMFLVKENDFVINRIWAQKGSAGIVPPEISGSVVTQDFPVFALDKTRVFPKYIAWYLRTPDFWEASRKQSSGTSGRQRLRPGEVENITFPLCDLHNQEQIASWIERIMVGIGKAQILRKEAIEKAELLMHSVLRTILSSCVKNPQCELGPIPRFAEVNPSKRGKTNISPSMLVSFVPMAAVDEATGRITKPITRPFAEVSKGYTWFEEGDLIFARITPCMQNGKAVLAEGLTNGIGLGSTEFHVLRPRSKIMGRWLHYLVRHKDFRDDAKKHFKGTAGQQRVPQSFLESKVIVVPPLDEQRRIVAFLDSLQTKLDALRKLQAGTRNEMEEVIARILDGAFKGNL